MTESTNNLGVIVNDQEGKTKELYIDEAIIPVRVPDKIFDQFVRAANFHQYPTVEAWAAATLVSSLEKRIGQPSISAPTQVSGQSSKLITGPKGGIISRG